MSGLPITVGHIGWPRATWTVLSFRVYGNSQRHHPQALPNVRARRPDTLRVCPLSRARVPRLRPRQTADREPARPRRVRRALAGATCSNARGTGTLGMCVPLFGASRLDSPAYRSSHSRARWPMSSAHNSRASIGGIFGVRSRTDTAPTAVEHRDRPGLGAVGCAHRDGTDMGRHLPDRRRTMSWRDGCFMPRPRCAAQGWPRLCKTRWCHRPSCLYILIASRLLGTRSLPWR